MVGFVTSKNARDAGHAFVERLLNGVHSLGEEEDQCQSYNVSYNSRDAADVTAADQYRISGAPAGGRRAIASKGVSTCHESGS